MLCNSFLRAFFVGRINQGQLVVCRRICHRVEGTLAIRKFSLFSHRIRMHTRASACVLFARCTHFTRILSAFLVISLPYRLASTPRALSPISNGYTMWSMPMALQCSKSFGGRTSVRHCDIYFKESDLIIYISIATFFHRKCQGFSEVMSTLSYVYQIRHPYAS